MNIPQKVVVFDLDETLGNFVELGMFCDALENFTKRRISEKQFFELIDLFHECLRPDIMKILDYLKKKKSAGDCEKIMIYTNNQGPKAWTENISKYFDIKLKTKLFDNIVAAFKVGGKRIELGRTSHDKTVRDLVNCTKIPVDTQICFLDDQYHPYMKHNNVYYINVKPYVHEYSFEEMATRYYNTYKGEIDKGIVLADFIKFIVDYMNTYDCKPMKMKTKEETDMDRIISKKILAHIKDFFNDKPSKTRRKSILSHHNSTKKKL
jgi:hypothetical protein